MSPESEYAPYSAKELTDKFTRNHMEYVAGPTATNPRFPDELLRIYRAIRWVERAEKENDDPDAAFIFYWIAFNAAYARDMPDEDLSEREEFGRFIARIDLVDKRNVIEDYVILKNHETVLNLVNNQYLFRDFWRHHHDNSKAACWERKLSESVRHTGFQLGRGDTVGVLTTLFDRLYVLRNQLVHGGATWNSSVNRSQVKDGARIMGFLVPAFIDLMMDNAYVFSDPPYYPFVGA